MKTTANKMNGMHLVKKTSILFFWCIMMLFSVKSFSQTNKGQDFWLAETPNLVSGNFAISVANPGVAPVNIVITNPTRATVNATIAAGSLQTFTFSTESGNIQNTGTYANNVYHVTAPSDVVVYDFTPLVNAYSNDAALILPTNSLGKKYRPGSYVNALGNSNGSFFGVLATVNGTNVKTYNRTGTLVDNVTINQGQYFQRNNGSTVAQDITGWYIESDQPVAVFSGNVCTSAGNSTSACDHIDEEVLPLESMASAYVACPTSIRPIGCTTPGSCSPDIFRYVATEDGTIITTSPNVGGGTINKGQFIEISTSTAHIVSSNNKPFYGYQYLISAGSGSPVANTGDPSLLDMPPVEQFQFNYIFLIPNTFAYNFINVVAPTGTTFTLDGSTLSNPCSVVGTLNGITYCTFHVQVTPGTHKIFANNQFGLIISGVDQYASYAYLGGVGLQPINAGCNTGGPYQVTTCSLAPIQLNGVGTCSDGSTPSSVQWTSTDGVVFSNANIANPTATVPGYGTFNICFTVTCGGNTVQCCSQITVNAPSGGCNAPPVAVCAPVTVSTNANCQGIAAAAAFNGGSTDPDAGDVITFSVSPVGPYSLGVTNVIFTATDSHGASSSCNTTITVVDNVKPTITCSSAITHTADAGVCSYSFIPPTPSASDNCSGVISVTGVRNDALALNAPYPVGTTTITWTATDASNNTSAPCTQNIIVTDDEKPVIACGAAITHTANAGVCSYTFTPAAPSISDNCPGVTVSGARSDAQPLSSAYPVGVTTITWTATDAHSNTNFCTQTVTITDDENPVITCGAPITHTANTGLCSYSFTPTPATATDNCPGVTVAGVRSDAQSLTAPYPVGLTTITWTATDAHAHSVTCTQTVTITDDESPVINCLSAITHTSDAGVCTYSFTPVPPTATDNCPGVTVAGTRSDALALTAPYPFGNTTITWTATDAHAHSVSCTQVVNVTDNQKPVINNLPANITINALNNNCANIVSWTKPTATDNCAIASFVSSDPFFDAAGYTFLSVGVTTVTYTATDIHGNVTTASFTVTVVDNQPPFLTGCPSNITVNAAAGRCDNTAIWNPPTASDNCPGVSLTTNHISGETFPVGTTVVTYTATDHAGLSVSCSFNVTVVDTQLPVITCGGPISVTNDAGKCGATVTVATPSATDNCPGVTVAGVRSDALALNALYPVGTTTITWTATDAHSNTATCTQTITVTDNEFPVINCAGAITHTANTGLCSYSFTPTAPTATDNCPGVTVAGVRSDAQPLTAAYPVGTTTITWTASDVHSHSITCTQAVTITDDENPVITCPSNITHTADAGVCTYSFTPTAATATDNCPGVTVTGTRSDALALNTPYPSGTTTITWTATDAHAHIVTCTQTITVTDNEKPTIVCAAAQTVNLDANCSAVLPDYRSLLTISDNCTPANALSVTQSPAAGTALNATGTLTVNFTVTDASGNSNTCSITVTKKDVTPPIIVCVAPIAVNNDANKCGAVVTYTTPIATDNCTSKPNVLILGADQASWVNQVKTGLQATNQFNSVDVFDITSGTPTLAQLNAYKSVLVWTDGGAQNSTQLGNVLASYIDGGGGVVDAVFDNASIPIAGNYNTSVYRVLNPLSQTQGARRTLGTVLLPAHPIMQGISSFDGGSSSYRSTSTSLTSGSYTIAKYDDGELFILAKENVSTSNARRASLNFFPPNNTSRSDFWVSTTDGSKIMANALTWVGNGGGGSATVTQTGGLPSGSLFPVGITTNTFVATDASGNTATCSFNVTVTDNQIPVITTNGNKSVNSDAGTCGAVVAVSATATDNCGVGAPTGVRSDALSLTAPYPVGSTTITWTATDINGNAAVAVTQTVTVTDNQIPVITTNGNKSVNSDAGTCGAVVTVSATATDNCGVGAPTGVRSDALSLTAPYPAGSTTITWTATDINGNAAVAVTQTVTVTDNQIPVITTNGNKSVNSDAGTCGAVVAVSATATDNCGVGAPTGVRSDALSLTAPYPVGSTTITWTATDINGNAAVAVTQTVTVTDNQIPVITTNGNKSVNSDAGTCGAVVTVSATATDNCGVGAPTGVRSDALSLTAPYPVGSTTITWTATDINGNAAVAVTQTITVTDNQIPVITTNGNKSVNSDAGTCGAVVAVSATATDNCGVGAPTGVRSDALALTAPYPVGSTTITWTATDINGNAAVAVTQTITVTDNQIPVITTNGNKSVNSDAGTCGAVVAVSATATDNCGVGAPTGVRSDALSLTAPYPVGSTTITWTATDINGNAAVPVTQTVIVTDNQFPLLVGVPANAIVACDSVPAPAVVTATDNCITSVPSFKELRTNGNCPNNYTLTRTWSTTDASNNTTTATQVITVRDTKAPVLSAAPANITVECDAVPVAATLTATDNCDAAPVVTYAEARTNGTSVNDYTLTRTWTATDACGNTSSKTQTITVHDTKAPVLTVPSAISVNTDNNVCGATVGFTATATDNCGPVTITYSKNSGTVFPTGTTVVTVTAKDASGNTTVKTFTVMVTDRQPATVVTKNITIPLSASGSASIAATDVNNGSSDACGIAMISVSPNTFSCANVGNNTVTLTVTDVNGNVSTGTAVVTIQDNTAPVVVTKNITIQLNASGTASIAATDVNNGSSDACGIATMSVSPNTFTCANVGANTVTLTVTDVNGNTSTGTATVTVQDNIAPVAITKNITVALNGSGQGTVVPSQVDNGSNDNCSVALSFQCATVGGQNLFSNGDFTSGYTGWTVSNVDNSGGWKATGGNPTGYYLLNSNGAVATDPTIQQTVTGLVPGQWYTISGQRNNIENGAFGNASALSFGVAVDNTVILQLANTGGATWIPFSVQFKATATSHVISFSAERNGDDTQYGVDNLSVVATPPASCTTGSIVFNCSNIGVNTVKLVVTDPSGNTATQTATVTVVDNLAPVITLPANATVNCGTSTAPSATGTATAADNCSTATVTYSDVTTGNVITRTWKAVDVYGNTSTGVQTITIVDNIKPVVVNPADITVTCSTLTSPSITGTATATDNCGIPTVTYSDVWYNSTTLLRFWKATDGFGNVSNVINAQTITINDNIKPVITDVPDITVNCGASTLPAATGTATATDNCGTPTVTYSDVTSGNVITRTWKATDGFGNVATSTQVITVGAMFTATVSSVPTSSTYTGGVSTNLYLGYGAQSTTLTMGSLPSAGAPYTYAWSGSYTNKLSSTTAASPVFTPATFGYYTFTVTVTNKYGCTSTASISICVTDVRVSGTSGITAQVYVCHVTTLLGHSTYTTLQVLTSAVSVYINSYCSDKLGSCSQSACNTTVANSIVGNSSGITKEGGTEVSTSNDELKVTVMPNPTNTFFTLKLESKYETPVNMRVMDANGRVIDAKSKIGANSTIQIGHNYSSGTYYAELIQGGQRKVVQMIKGK